MGSSYFSRPDPVFPHSLAVGSVERENAPRRVVKGLARHPVPVMILARLAVDNAHQRKGHLDGNQRFVSLIRHGPQMELHYIIQDACRRDYPTN